MLDNLLGKMINKKMQEELNKRITDHMTSCEQCRGHFMKIIMEVTISVMSKKEEKKK
jgi:hypothetical protein